eukprot:scaffold31306_cov33-Prasinocladus_malaysianus.AAC.1
MSTAFVSPGVSLLENEIVNKYRTESTVNSLEHPICDQLTYGWPLRLMPFSAYQRQLVWAAPGSFTQSWRSLAEPPSPGQTFWCPSSARQ